jgi:hypothetical protein
MSCPGRNLRQQQHYSDHIYDNDVLYCVIFYFM